MMTRHLWRSLLGLLVGVLALTVVASAGAAMRGSGPIHGAVRDCPQGTCMALTVTLNGHPVSYRSLGRSVAGRATSIGASTARGSVVANDVTAFTPTGIHDGYNLPWNSGVQQTIALIDAYYHPSMKNDLDVFDNQWNLGSFPYCTSTVTTACFDQVDQNGNHQGFNNPNNPDLVQG
jgi:hypothetical protein